MDSNTKKISFEPGAWSVELVVVLLLLSVKYRVQSTSCQPSTNSLKLNKKYQQPPPRNDVVIIIIERTDGCRVADAS